MGNPIYLRTLLSRRGRKEKFLCFLNAERLRGSEELGEDMGQNTRDTISCENASEIQEVKENRILVLEGCFLR